MDNDANVAALGEKWLGAGRDVENMAMLTLGTGIGGAIVLGGKLFYGMSGMAGEFGHVTIEPKGVLCGCGNRGCAGEQPFLGDVGVRSRSESDSPRVRLRR